MSASAPRKALTKKQKKALAFRENRGRSKKDASGTAGMEVDDVPVAEDQDDVDGTSAALENTTVDKIADASLSKASKSTAKAKGKGKAEEGERNQAASVDAEVAKSKKRKRDDDNDKMVVDTDGDSEAKKKRKTNDSKQRFILFVGTYI